MRIIACGGRNFEDAEAVDAALARFRSPTTLIAQGGARGADQLVRVWCQFNNVAWTTFEAAWNTHGRSAGPIRNRHMLAAVEPHLVVAFPGGRGTDDMVAAAVEAGVEVLRA